MTIAPVSIIVPTYNRSRYIVESIESLLNQTLPAKQLIVINDGSTDETEDKLKPFIESNQITYLKVENGGKSKALNIAYPYVTGDYVWVFDDDDFAFSDTIEKHMRVFQQYPEIGFTCSNFYYGTSDRNDCIIQQKERKLLKIPPKKAGDVFYDLLDVCFIRHCDSIVKKTCYDQIGLFDEELIRSQDYDILLRLSANYKTVYVDKPTCILRHHEGVRGSKKQSFKNRQASRMWGVYDRLIFKKVYKDVSLIKFSKNSSDETWALIKRMKVMTSRGLWAEALDDLARLKQSNENQYELNSQLDHELMCTFDNFRLARELASTPMTTIKYVVQLLKIRNLSISKSLFKGCFYRFYAAVVKLRFIDSVAYLLLCLAFFIPYLVSKK